MRWLAVALVALVVGCGKGGGSSKPAKRPKVGKAPAASAPAATPAATGEPAGEASAETSAPEVGEPSAPTDVTPQGAAPALLPDSEPAGAPFASSIAAAVAEVTQQGGANLTSRVYRAAFEQARREINPDNARAHLRELEKQVDAERQALP